MLKYSINYDYMQPEPRDHSRISKHLEQLLIRIFQFFKIGAPAPHLVNSQKHLENVLHP